MQVQQSLTLMRQAFITLFRQPGSAEETGFRPTTSITASAATDGVRPVSAAEASDAASGPASRRKGSAALPTGVAGFIAERIYMPESTLGLPRGYFIDIRV